MNRLKQIKTYPFGFFLILEWMFFGAAFFSELPSKFLLHGQPDDRSLFVPILSLLCLIALGFMGLSLPKNKPWHKWLYTFGQLVLLGLPSLFQHFCRGFNPKQNTTGFGLQGMRERFAALGGDLTLRSRSRSRLYY